MVGFLLYRSGIWPIPNKNRRIKWSNYEKFSPDLHPSLMFLFGRQKFAHLFKFGSSSSPWPLSSVTHVEMLVCKWMPSGNSRLDTKLAFTKQTFSLSPLFGWVYLCSTFCHSISEEADKTSQELRMLSSVAINCQVTKIVMNSGSQLSEL